MIEDDLKKLSDPTYSIEIRFVRRKVRDESVLDLVPADVNKIIEEITALPSRQDAQRMLDAKYSTRKQLEPIARKLDIPIIKQDKMETLRDKVIEATVGARIRSQAIQGTGG